MLPASPGQYDQPIALDLSMRTRAELRAHDLEVRLDGFPQDVASDRAYYKVRQLQAGNPLLLPPETQAREPLAHISGTEVPGSLNLEVQPRELEFPIQRRVAFLRRISRRRGRCAKRWRG